MHDDIARLTWFLFLIFREPLDHLVLQELRAPLVCKVCPEREELAVSQEPRETG